MASLINVDDIVVNESDPTATFTISLTEPSAVPVSVNWAAGNLTAFNGQDYVAASGTANFAPGQTSQQVQISLIDTPAAERVELFALGLFSSVGAEIGKPIATATIIDNDGTPGVPIIKIADTLVDESAAKANFVLTLDRPSASTVSVTAATANGTAVAGSDFSAVAAQVVSFPPGVMTRTVSVDLINDTAAEPAEYFDLVLTNAVGATLPDNRGRAVIAASDVPAVATPVITVRDTVVSESDGYADFVVSLSAPSTQVVTVSYAAGNRTAGNGADYVADSGFLRFNPGETVKTVRLAVIDDTAVEPAELFAFGLFSPVNAEIGRPVATATIVDNDAAAGVPVIKVSDTLVDEKAGQVQFSVTLDKPSTNPVSVNYATVNGSAVAGSDYQALPAQGLSFAPGEVAKTVTVNLIDDGIAEPAESFDLLLSNVVGATLPDNRGHAVIAASDAPAVATPLISVADTVVSESDGYAEFVVSLSAPSTQVVTVSYAAGNLTAGNGADYVADSGFLRFSPGETVKTVRLAVIDDTGVESPELFAFGLSFPVNGQIGKAIATATIMDNDAAAGTPVIRVSDAVADEKAGQAYFNVTLDKPSTSTVTVNYATDDVTALAGAGLDYQALAPQALAFAPGEVAKTVAVNLIDDGAAEPAEAFDLLLSSPVNGTLPDNRARAVIAASDAPPAATPTISASAGPANEGAGYAEVVFALNVPSTNPVRFSYSLSNGTAFNGTDYVADSGTLGFAPGETIKTLRFAIIDDAVVETTETFNVNLSSAVGGVLGTTSTVVSIVDNDGPPSAAVLNVSGSGGPDILRGTPNQDALSGFAGNDFLDGGGGPDSLMDGGAGDDIYVLENLGDSAVEAPNGGRDTVISFLSSHTLAANIEDLVLAGSAVTGIGNGLNNTITGTAGNNTLDGGAGIDTVSYANAPAAVTVNLGLTTPQPTGGGGTDTLSNFENVIGSRFNDTLTGGAGPNSLNGGPGADAMAGGAGNDAYVVDHAGDTVTENPGEGIDTVQSSITYTLGPNVENLTLTGNQPINGTGNGLNNVIAGNAAANVLDGGAGVDTVSYAESTAGVQLDLAAGQATVGAVTDTLLNFENVVGSRLNDFLFGDAGNNVITGGLGDDTIDGGAGIDTASYAGPASVTVSLSIAGAQNTLGAGFDTLSNIENLVGSSANDNLTGNALANALDGGPGADTLTGLGGNDIYIVDNAGDLVIEAAGGGTDTVQSSVTYTLPANVENLTLTGGAPINGTGNAIANRIIGNAAANVITGGPGADTLTGAGGADTFVFNSKVGVDTITDFLSGTDKLRFIQAAIPIGDGDALVEGAVSVAGGAGSFPNTAELVIVQNNIAGAINAASAAAVIGGASGAYATGRTVLFAVDNGVSSGLFLFTSSGADATVSAAELTQLGVLAGTPATALADYVFAP